MPLSDHDIDDTLEKAFGSLNLLSKIAGQNSADHAFREEGRELRIALDDAVPGTMMHRVLTRSVHRYWGDRLMLIVGEVAEAHEQLRKGRSMTETYYPEAASADSIGKVLKPEGVPSELADVAIRLFDLADEIGLDLGAITREKMRYNETRPPLHNKLS